MYFSKGPQFERMRFVKQKDQLGIMNFDVCIKEGDPNSRRHGILLPNTVRGIICGPSNCGKTNVMLSLLFNENGLRFENIYVYSKSLYQSKYQLLETVMKRLPNVKYFPYKENDDIIDPKDARLNSIFVFDDVACDRQDKIRSYFCMGRHKLVDSFYLCQTYTRIPKHLIRDNANFLILFKQDITNLRHVYEDHVGTDMSFDQFKSMCSECWRDQYGFLIIDKDSDINDGRYRKKFDCYICM